MRDSDPRLLSFFNSLIQHKWLSKYNLADFVRIYEGMSEAEPKYDITIIHAEDDYDIPWSHSDRMFWHAVSATRTDGIGFEDFEAEKEQLKKEAWRYWMDCHPQDSKRGRTRGHH